MASAAKPTIIALEEHYWDPDLVATFPGQEGRRLGFVEERLLDMGEVRLREMDEAGIDIQVLSHGAPATQKMDAALAVTMARQTNDRLSAFIKSKPTRFAAFAALPTPDPAAAAAELERCVNELGFKGAMIHGLTNGHFIDEKQFWPIFERAQALDVPIYLHPSFPDAAVTNVYYKDYAAQYPALLGPALGFTVEAATQAVRMVLSGVFEAYPKLKIIIGHLGEAIPFLLWRINQSLSRPENIGNSFGDVFREHFYVTTSGNFSDNALTCAIAELGVNRVLFSVDWPFISNKLATDWMHATSLSEADKLKIFSGTTRKLLRM
jgi:predicted TIM-barrel fold metal-dependent hydrolase